MDLKDRLFSLLNLSPEERLPSFLGIIEVKHYVKGRIRLLIPILKDNKEGGDALLADLKKLPQLKSIRLTTLTGSLLLEFDEKQISAATIVAILIRLLRLESEIEKQPQSLVLGELGMMQKAINRAVFEKSKGIFNINSLLFLGFSGFGIYQFFHSKMKFPPALSLIWWAYNILNNRQR